MKRGAERATFLVPGPVQKDGVRGRSDICWSAEGLPVLPGPPPAAGTGGRPIEQEFLVPLPKNLSLHN